MLVICPRNCGYLVVVYLTVAGGGKRISDVVVQQIHFYLGSSRQPGNAVYMSSISNYAPVKASDGVGDICAIGNAVWYRASEDSGETGKTVIW